MPLLKALGAAPFKITLPAPSNFVPTGFKPGVTDRHYRDRDALLADLVAIVKDEVAVAGRPGSPLHPARRAVLLALPRSRSTAKRCGSRAAIRTRTSRRRSPATTRPWRVCRASDVTLAVHICRGNSRSRWYTEGGYDAIAEKLFARLDVDRFLLEYDTERSGTFEPLRLVPRGKDVVLGLVTTKEPRLESRDDLRRRIDEAARYVPLEHLALSPQCGFASVASGNLLSIDDQWRKLELVAGDGARRVGQLQKVESSKWKVEKYRILFNFPL